MEREGTLILRTHSFTSCMCTTGAADLAIKLSVTHSKREIKSVTPFAVSLG